MTLPRRIPKQSRHSNRWRSPAHRDFVRSHACCFCGSSTNRVFAHVRIGSNAGMGEKPDDWRGTVLCDGPHSNIDQQLGCHNRQHVIGERTFWAQYEQKHGQTVEDLIAEFIKASPRRREIEQAIRERADG
jgi:hypothetical protein